MGHLFVLTWYPSAAGWSADFSLRILRNKFYTLLLLSRFKLLGGDYIASDGFLPDQTLALIKGKCNLNAFKTKLVAHQCFTSDVSPLIEGIQTMLQVKASLNGFAAAMATHVNPMGVFIRSLFTTGRKN